MRTLPIVCCKFFISHNAKRYLVPFQTTMMDFFLQNISTWTFDRVLYPPYFDMTTEKLSMIIQKRGISFGRTPFNQSKGLSIKFCLTQVFKLTSFTVFSYLENSYPRVYCTAKLYFMFSGFWRELPKMGACMKVNFH